jgi:hypothetical protein
MQFDPLYVTPPFKPKREVRDASNVISHDGFILESGKSKTSTADCSKDFHKVPAHVDID